VNDTTIQDVAVCRNVKARIHRTFKCGFLIARVIKKSARTSDLAVRILCRREKATVALICGYNGVTYPIVYFLQTAYQFHSNFHHI